MKIALLVLSVLFAGCGVALEPDASNIDKADDLKNIIDMGEFVYCDHPTYCTAVGKNDQGYELDEDGRIIVRRRDAGSSWPFMFGTIENEGDVHLYRVSVPCDIFAQYPDSAKMVFFLTSNSDSALDTAMSITTTDGVDIDQADDNFQPWASSKMDTEQILISRDKVLSANCKLHIYVHATKSFFTTRKRTGSYSGIMSIEDRP